MGYPRAEVNRIVQAAKPVYSLTNVRAGRYFTARGRDENAEIYYAVDDEKVLHLSRQDKRWKAEMTSRIAFTRASVFEGKISDNLFSDAARAGMDDRTTMNLVGIFAWDIDFVRDLRHGDSFKVLAEDRFGAEGRLIGT